MFVGFEIGFFNFANWALVIVARGFGPCGYTWDLGDEQESSKFRLLFGG